MASRKKDFSKRKVFSSCRLCNKLFDDDMSFLNHFTETHKYVPVPNNDFLYYRHFHCSFCKKEFNNQNSVYNHIVSHFGILPYFCGYCKFETISKLHYTHHFHSIAHNFVSSGSLQHQCELCDSSFATLIDLQKHSLIHLTEMEFSCAVCQVWFYKRRDLLIHSHIHTSSNVCRICFKEFQKQSYLLLHVLTHNKSEYFSKFNNVLSSNYLLLVYRDNFFNEHIPNEPQCKMQSVSQEQSLSQEEQLNYGVIENANEIQTEVEVQCNVISDTQFDAKCHDKKHLSEIINENVVIGKKLKIESLVSINRQKRLSMAVREKNKLKKPENNGIETNVCEQNAFNSCRVTFPQSSKEFKVHQSNPEIKKHCITKKNSSDKSLNVLLSSHRDSKSKQVLMHEVLICVEKLPDNVQDMRSFRAYKRSVRNKTFNYFNSDKIDQNLGKTFRNNSEKEFDNENNYRSNCSLYSGKHVGKRKKSLIKCNLKNLHVWKYNLRKQNMRFKKRPQLKKSIILLPRGKTGECRNKTKNMHSSETSTSKWKCTKLELKHSKTKTAKCNTLPFDYSKSTNLDFKRKPSPKCALDNCNSLPFSLPCSRTLQKKIALPNVASSEIKSCNNVKEIASDLKRNHVANFIENDKSINLGKDQSKGFEYIENNVMSGKSEHNSNVMDEFALPENALIIDTGGHTEVYTTSDGSTYTRNKNCNPPLPLSSTSYNVPIQSSYPKCSKVCSSYEINHEQEKNVLSQKRKLSSKMTALSRVTNITSNAQHKKKCSSKTLKRTRKCTTKKFINTTKSSANINNIRQLSKRMQNKIVDQTKNLKVELFRLPEVICEKYLTNKPITLTNMLPLVKSVRTVGEGKCNISTSHVSLEHSYSFFQDFQNHNAYSITLSDINSVIKSDHNYSHLPFTQSTAKKPEWSPSKGRFM